LTATPAGATKRRLVLVIVFVTGACDPIATDRLGTMRAWRQAMIRHVGEDWAYWADF
jgi:hypothetical protein